jgi:hypothetical protein
LLAMPPLQPDRVAKVFDWNHVKPPKWT